MKKSLFALAALGAFASAAQAQSSVTLYGSIDASVAYLTGLPTSNVAASSNTSTSTAITGNGFGYIDSSWATSNWGLRGSESLGGGLTASFNAESDLLTNNGNIHRDTNGSYGLFRRAAFVSLTDANLGGVSMGRIPNAYIQATGQMLPVSGNTAHQWRSVIGSSIGDQLANSIRYSTPTIMATNIAVQYAFSNTVNENDAGSAFAAHLVNQSIAGLQLTAGYNVMKGQTVATAALGTNTVGSSNAAANPTKTNREGYAVGLKYKFTPAIEVGAFYANGRTNDGGIGASTNDRTDTAMGIGAGYQATPAVLLGANYVKTDLGASMINLQAHYSLSKRTRLYSQLTFTSASDQTAQKGGAMGLNFSPIASNSNTQNSSFGGLPGTAGSANTPGSSNGYSLGVIHSF